MDSRSAPFRAPFVENLDARFHNGAKAEICGSQLRSTGKNIDPQGLSSTKRDYSSEEPGGRLFSNYSAEKISNRPTAVPKRPSSLKPVYCPKLSSASMVNGSEAHQEPGMPPSARSQLWFNLGVSTFWFNVGVSIQWLSLGVSTQRVNLGVSTLQPNFGVSTQQPNIGVSTQWPNPRAITQRPFCSTDCSPGAPPPRSNAP